MMEPLVLEGTWEEIDARLKDRSEELRRYSKMRVIVVPEETLNANDAPLSLADALADLLEEAKHVKREKPVAHKDPYEIAFGEIIKEKYRKMGFKL